MHAWAAWKVYEIDKEIYGEKDGDKVFLKKISGRLCFNFLWWVNTKKLELAYWVVPEGFYQKPIKKKAVYSAGFLGLDNIWVIGRN